MNISIEQTNRLFQKLSSVQKRDDGSLPDEINQSIEAIMEAQKEFIRIVDRFVHNVDHVRSVDVVADIIDTCPQFLSSRNKHGLLPIHTACFRDSCSVYVPLFASAGVKHCVGGVNGRGGLLEETRKGNNTYELLAGSTDAIYKDDKCLVDTMKVFLMEGEQDPYLKKYYPQTPLLYKQELHQSGFLLKALNNERIAMTKHLIKSDPMKLYTDILDNRKETTSGVVSVGTWPIHIACNNARRNESSYKIFQYLLQSGMKYRSIVTDKNMDDYLGGLFAIDTRTNETTFELAVKAFGEDKTWNCVVKCIPPSSSSSSSLNSNDYRILQRAVSLPLHYLNGFLKRYPRAYFARDESGNLPIHHALKEGVEWSTELISIINANISSLNKRDPCFNLHPFALAAAGPKYDLSSIFYMLSLHPEHITSGLDKVSKIEPESNSNVKGEIVSTPSISNDLVESSSTDNEERSIEAESIGALVFY